MADFLKTIDERCGTTQNNTALSIFSATSSGVLILLTVPLNSVIIFSLWTERKRKYSSLFYKLLFNIAVADLLTGLIADPSAVNALVKEALRIKLKLFEIYLIHVSLFFTDAVALLTLTILSIDRIIALIFPIAHHKGVKRRTAFALVFSAWPFAFCLVLPYFKLNFIKQLLVFSTVNIVVTILALIVTTITYKHKLKPKVNKPKGRSFSKMDSSINMNAGDTSQHGEICEDVDHNSTQTSSNVDQNMSSKQARSQQKATRTFLLMLCVFITTYLPTAFTMIYMNACEECNCAAIHIMRDISILSILSSSVFRPLNFVLTLKHLRASVIGIFIKKKENCNASNTSGITAQ